MKTLVGIRLLPFCSLLLTRNLVTIHANHCSSSSSSGSNIKGCIPVSKLTVATAAGSDTNNIKMSAATEGLDAASAYVPGSSSVAFITTPDENSAKKLARGLVERKLAACVNIIPKIQSIYMWEGKINEDNEYLLMIKTRTSRVDEISKWVRENHPYSVAEVITLPIENGNAPYLKWIGQTVPDKD